LALADQKSSVLLYFRNKRREYNNFGVQLVQKFLILAEKINIEVLLVVHWLNPKPRCEKMSGDEIYSGFWATQNY